MNDQVSIPSRSRNISLCHNVQGGSRTQYSQQVPVTLPPGVKWACVKVIIYLHLMLMLRICEAVPPLDVVLTT
jgi:hypothetical protein